MRTCAAPRRGRGSCSWMRWWSRSGGTWRACRAPSPQPSSPWSPRSSGLGVRKQNSLNRASSFILWLATCDGEEGHQDVRQSDVEKHCPATSLAKSVPGENIKHSETDTFLSNVEERHKICFWIIKSLIEETGWLTLTFREWGHREPHCYPSQREPSTLKKIKIICRCLIYNAIFEFNFNMLSMVARATATTLKNKT